MSADSDVRVVRFLSPLENVSSFLLKCCEGCHLPQRDCLHDNIFYLQRMLLNQLDPLLLEDIVCLQAVHTWINIHHFLDQSTELLMLGLKDDLGQLSVPLISHKLSNVEAKKVIEMLVSFWDSQSIPIIIIGSQETFATR